MKAKAELWTCPRCGERFATRNTWHACGSFELEPLFARSEPAVRLEGHLILAAMSDSPCFVKVISFSPRNHQHVFRLENERQIGGEFCRHLREVARSARESTCAGPERPGRRRLSW